MRRQVSEWIARYRGSWSFASDTFRMVAASILASISQMVLVFLLVNIAGWLPDAVSSRPVSLFIWYFLFCLYYVILCQIAFGRHSSEELHRSLRDTKSSTRGPLMSFIYGESGTSHATMFSFVALVGVGIVAFDPDVANDSRHESIIYATSLLTVVGSWMSNVVSFALQYARDESETDQKGFQFPNDDAPVWFDYVYASVMISASLSTADVIVVSKPRRKLVVVNTIIAFMFNTVIIAMLIAAIM